MARGIGALAILAVFLIQGSSSLLAPQRAQRHMEGAFTSELSRLRESAFVQSLVRALVGLGPRTQRHSDGTFTSELSKIRGTAQVHRLIQQLVGKRSAVLRGRSTGSPCPLLYKVIPWPETEPERKGAFVWEGTQSQRKWRL
uniref:Secretin n=1 Tax=Phascolarctos cinereus TaxID=38626 RepID=A0A6P5JUI2_PHACI|nr:secretin isoform X2 [Phascolarctos cinereus]